MVTRPGNNHLPQDARMLVSGPLVDFTTAKQHVLPEASISPELIKQTDLVIHNFHRDYEFSWFSATS